MPRRSRKLEQDHWDALGAWQGDDTPPPGVRITVDGDTVDGDVVEVGEVSAPRRRGPRRRRDGRRRHGWWSPDPALADDERWADHDR